MLDRVCRELACIISRAVLLSRVQFVIMHVILPVERKTLPTGWRSLMRSSARDERSFIIHQVRPTVRVTDIVYINTWFSFTGRSLTSHGESFAKYHFAYASTPTHAVYADGLRCIASHFAIESIYFLSRMIVKCSSNIKLYSSYFSDTIMNLNDISR